MKIYIATDSRGSVDDHASKFTRETCWTNRFMAKYPSNEYVARRSAIELPTHHLFDSELLNRYADGYFDIAFLHTAMNTGIEYYSPGIFQSIFPKYYTPAGLIHGHGDRFIYSHPESEAIMFELIRKKCKRVVWIGLHSMTSYRSNEASSKWTPSYNELAESQNTRYSKLVTDYVALPWDESWVDENCHPDRLHYLEPGVTYLLNLLDHIYQDVANEK